MDSKARFAVVLVAIVLGIAVGLFLESLQPVAAQRLGNSGNGATLLMTTADAADGGQHVILIDPGERVIGTYHVDGTTGGVSLRSVRNFRWDLMMDEFNSSEPKPKEIRALLEQK